MGFLAFLGFLAGLVGLAAWIWLIVVAFRNEDRLWGGLMIVGIIIPGLGPFLPLIYAITHFQQCRKPAILFFSSGAAGLLFGILTVMGIKSEIENNPEFKKAMAEIQEAQRQGGAPVRLEPREVPPAEPAAPAEEVRPAAPPPPDPPAPRLTPPAPKPPPPVRTAEATPPARPPAVDRSIPPAKLQMVTLGDANPNRMRALRLRVVNNGEKPIRELRLKLVYLDSQKDQLGTWTTIHVDTNSIVRAHATNEFDMTAFFVPQFTQEVAVDLAGLAYTDGERWP